MDFSVEFCVDLMPELKGLELCIQELKGGITNRLYRVVSSDGGDYVFRFYGAKTELFIDREVEMENLRRLESSGVTQRLVKYLPERNVTVVEFIPGYVLKNPDFLREDLWERIMRPIRIVHQSRVNLPYRFDPLLEVKRFYKILEGINPNYPEFDSEERFRPWAESVRSRPSLLRNMFPVTTIYWRITLSSQRIPTAPESRWF